MKPWIRDVLTRYGHSGFVRASIKRPPILCGQVWAMNDRATHRCTIEAIVTSIRPDTGTYLLSGKGAHDDDFDNAVLVAGLRAPWWPVEEDP